MDSLRIAATRPVEMHHDEILARARAGCMPSFGELIGRYERQLTRYVDDTLRHCRGRCHRDDTDDVMQETWLRVLRSLDRYDSRWAFSTWLFTIARRSCLNRLRAAGRTQALESAAARRGEEDRLPGPLAQAIETERARHLWKLVSGTLPQRQATAVRLHYGEGMAIDDVAAAVGTSPGAVKLTLFRARRRLASLISSGFLVASAVILAARPGAWRSDPPTGVVVAEAESFAVELLPTPHDLHEALLLEGSTLAARALGLPPWNELAEFGSQVPDRLPHTR